MSTNPDVLRQLLRQFDFKALFNKLGWDHHQARPLPVGLDSGTYTLDAVAQKRGMVAYVCTPGPGGTLPGPTDRSRIDREATKAAHEHIVVFTDEAKTTQVWQVRKRQRGKPASFRQHTYHKDQPGDSLLQKLQGIRFTLAEEEHLTQPEVPGRVRAAFDVDRITKRFYELFKKEHAAFLKFIEGIPFAGDREWYASVMLNRLMFVYFIQKQGFLDNDRFYLANRLKLVKQKRGQDQFHSFYRHFLLRLFHEGLAQPVSKRKAGLDALLGKVPYLNGGIFDLHELEQKHTDIKIPDAAFERIFAFFDDYQWHLDDRPLAKDNEINPDVLGYIFEKYINQKQMGAYYTKEDITGYIARNTIVPFLLDAVARACPDAFRPDGPVWRLLREEPDKYIFGPVRHGVDRKLPPEIAAGLDNVAERKDWNRLAPIGFALPTETWREHIARRRRCLDIRQKLAAGEIHTTNELITYNLDVCQFAEDVLDTCDDPKLLHAFWQALEKVSILDPTCGSGAFLFAALNILQLLYDACLDRMQACLDDFGESSAELADFRKILDQLERHPSRDYFIFKSIIVQNLYGVDVMREAVEICKLRLFLKLVSQVQRVEHLEPLPDIDFNIRAGNTLVGFATLAEVEKTLEGNLGFSQDEFEEIVAAAKRADEEFRLFRSLQTEFGKEAVDFSDVKGKLRTHLDTLGFRLDYYLAGQYGKDTTSPTEVGGWILSHQPFHWFAEFYGIMNRGGFDVIIGNPPYVEYRLVRDRYRLLSAHYEAESAANLYAFCMERSARLVASPGRFGMIVPSGLLGLDEVSALRRLLLDRYSQHWFSTYAIRPSKLFEGVDQRLCINLADASRESTKVIRTTRYQHWSAEERPHLFPLLSYEKSFVYPDLDRIPQIGCRQAAGIFAKLVGNRDHPLREYLAAGKSGSLVHYHRSPRYWIRGMDFEQYFKSPTRSRSVHHFRDLFFRSEADGKVAAAVLNTSLFFFWFLSVGNGRNLTGTDVERFPLGKLTTPFCQDVAKAFRRLMEDYKAHSLIRTRKDCEFQEFRPSRSKPILDEIDGLFAHHYGFTAEELDFIVNYETKYRLGQDAGDGEEDE